MVVNVTPEEQAKYRELNKLRMKLYRDKKRVRKYSPHPTVTKKTDSCVQPNSNGEDKK
jgi:hypothetical protein